MKIRKVFIRNLNSLKGDHTVDFTIPPLSESGLFAITGPTGIGKSTILDAICLALYNQVPRFDRKISRDFVRDTGALLTKGAEQAIASVEYSCEKGIFSSQWSIAVNRNGNLNDYDMQVADASGNILNQKRTEAPELNAEKIGLTFDQFSKSILLAQGEFARFLKSSKSERSDLLEKITGAHIYRQIGKKAFEINRERARDLERITVALEQEKGRLMPEEQRKQLKEQLQEIEKKIAADREKQVKIRELLGVKEQIRNLQEEIKRNEEEIGKVVREIDRFEASYGERLRKHERLTEHTDLLDRFRQLNRALTDLQRDLQGQTDRYKVLESQVNGYVGAASGLTGVSIERETLVARIKATADKVKAMDSELTSIRERYKSEWNSLKELSADLNLQLNDKIEGEEEKRFRTAIEEQKLKITQARSKYGDSNLEQLKAQSESILARISSLESVAEKIKRISLSKEREKTLSAEIEEARVLLKNLPAEIKDIEQQLVETDLKKQIARLNQEKHLLLKEFNDYRQKLVKGEACPLCGATDHPLAGHREEPGEEDHSLKELEAESVRLTREKTVRETRIISIGEQIDRLTNALESAVKERKAEESALDQWAQKEKVDVATLDVNQLRESLSMQRKELDQSIELLSKAGRMKRLEEVTDEVSRLLSEGSQLKDNIETITKGKTDDFLKKADQLSSDFQAAERDIFNLNQQMTEYRSRISNTQQELAQAREKLSPVLTEMKLESVEKALETLFPPTEYTRIKNEQSALSNRLSGLKQAMETRTASLEAVRKKDSDKDENSIRAELIEINERIELIQQERDLINSSYSTQADILQRVEQLKLEYEKEATGNLKWRLLAKEIGDAEGNRYATFAQELTLRHLVSLANQQLKRLSGRYLLDLPGDAEADELVTIDLEMGMERRSVRTLSGGESFLISLSLALSLSELASRNVQIESLFIDEGFGTLDPETLEQVLGTLDILQSTGKKTIGIISHVTELKERIATRVEVKRNGQGFGKVTVR